MTEGFPGMLAGCASPTALVLVRGSRSVRGVGWSGNVARSAWDWLARTWEDYKRGSAGGGLLVGVPPPSYRAEELVSPYATEEQRRWAREVAARSQRELAEWRKGKRAPWYWLVGLAGVAFGLWLLVSALKGR